MDLVYNVLVNFFNLNEELRKFPSIDVIFIANP
jgi:hypothetical protein